ncbi:hypothetical protein ARMGADRAFT_271297 [Armillaria gallica]|uniref:Uncharacterized protein n=1 Tax=Armillaria gallica TaxID=47427 RepID=A0A2H3E8V3_ARMGA|nr:hypothetical protein ARMGADRAFT_271297 [Armillaria gallica]
MMHTTSYYSCPITQYYLWKSVTSERATNDWRQSYFAHQCFVQFATSITAECTHSLQTAYGYRRSWLHHPDFSVCVLLSLWHLAMFTNFRRFIVFPLPLRIYIYPRMSPTVSSMPFLRS